MKDTLGRTVGVLSISLESEHISMFWLILDQCLPPFTSELRDSHFHALSQITDTG